VIAVLRMNVQTLFRSAAAAALVLAPPAARAAVVSPEVEARVRFGEARIPVVVSLRTGAERPGFSVTRRLVNAPVVAGWATAADIAACNLICRQVHGFDRDAELRDALDQKTASVVEHLGRIAGYTTGIAFFAHTVADTNNGLMALIGAAPEFGGPGFLLPTRNHEVFDGCLRAGLKLVYQMTLMTIGLYQEPEGAYLPSVLY